MDEVANSRTPPEKDNSCNSHIAEFDGSAESTLMARARAGDCEALSSLLVRYGSAVRQSIRFRIPARFRSVLSEDDVMQESYAEAFLSFGQLNDQESLEAWLKRIARNNLRDAVKELNALKRGGTVQRPRVARSGPKFEALAASLSDSGTTPSGHAKRNELCNVFNRVLPQLPDAYRRVVQLYDLELRSADEVAEMLNCSPGAVFMRRARAHAMLKQLLGTLSDYV